MDIINVIFDALSSILTNVISLVGDSFTGVTSLWYVAPTGTETTGSLTLLGVLSLIAFAFGVVWLAIRFVGSMISLKQAGR